MSDLRETERGMSAAGGSGTAPTQQPVADPSLDETRARAFLCEAPDNPDALLMLGTALRRRGKAAAARTILEQLTGAQPQMSAAFLELGLAFVELGDNRAATAALIRAANLAPDNPGAWQALGDQFTRIESAKNADNAYAKQFELLIDEPQLREASLALRDGRPESAEQLLREFVQLHPTDVNALKLLAETAIRFRRMADAELLLKDCIDLAPDFLAARYRYATVVFQRNKPAQALAELHVLVAQDPHNFRYRQLMANTLVHIGEFAKAAAEYGILLKNSPNQPRAWMAYGHALKALGRYDESIAAYKKAIELLPQLANAWWNLASLKTYRFEPQEVDSLRILLSRADIVGKERGLLMLAYARILEDGRQYAESFETCREANVLLRSGMRYDADETTEFVQRCKVSLTADFFRGRPPGGHSARDPVFIVGMPRSGSTLVEQILASHAAIEGTNEPQIITRVVGRADASLDAALAQNPGVLRELDPLQLRSLGEEFMEHARALRKLDRPYVTHRMPENFRHIGLIHLILPNAKIIDVRRHPMACCLSNYKQHFGGGRSFAYSLTDLGRYYADYVELMAHFDDVLPGKVYRVFYEQLVENPEKEVRRLLEYLELPFEDRCLRFYENTRDVRAAGSDQVRMPIFKDAVHDWKNYERWLEPLKAALGYVLDSYPQAAKFYIRLHARMEQPRVSWGADQNPWTGETPWSVGTAGEMTTAI